MFRKRRSVGAPEVIARPFRWLTDLGYAISEADHNSGSPSATFANETVIVRASYHWHDTYAQVTVARRRETDLASEPFWAQVHLNEILTSRAPAEVRWNESPPDDRDLDGVFEQGAQLLRDHALDLLRGENLTVLDQLIEKRPRRGVPGLDFPTEEPWFSSQEGFWMTTDRELPLEMETYLERSRSDDPLVRAIAALKIPLGVTRDRHTADAGLVRLRELLRDPDADVRRAAASGLSNFAGGDALDEVLMLLADEGGDKASPVAAAATFMVLDADEQTRRRVLEALREFERRGAPAATQVDRLAWRLERDPSRGYPRVIQMWTEPEGPDA